MVHSHQQGQLQHWTMAQLCLPGFLSKEMLMELLFCTHHTKGQMADHNNETRIENRNKRILQQHLPCSQKKEELIHCQKDCWNSLLWSEVTQHGKTQQLCNSPWFGTLVFKPILIPALEVREAPGCPTLCLDTTAGWHHYLTSCKNSQIPTELSEQVPLTSLWLDCVDKHNLITSAASWASLGHWVQLQHPKENLFCVFSPHSPAVIVVYWSAKVLFTPLLKENLPRRVDIQSHPSQTLCKVPPV